ncbi:MAG: 6-phosphogluconolactonase [Pseudomonadota bacterium]
MIGNFHEFGDRLTASEAAADWIGAALDASLQGQESASLVVSGGSTPVHCFEALAQTPLGWPRISVFMSDERCVPPEHADSNEAMIRRTLLTGQATGAELVPMFREGLAVDGMCAALARRLAAEPGPFAAVLLGMGADGHFASLFPDFDDLALGLDLEQGPRCMPVATKASPHPRISLTLASLVRTSELILLAFGEAKRTVLKDAAAGRGGYPVQALLAQDRTPVKIAWAP